MAARRILTLWLLCVCLCLIPCRAWAVSTADAAQPLDLERDCALTLAYRCDDIAVADLTVRLYCVAQADAAAQYTLTAPFAASGLDLNGIQTAGEWDVIRSTLESHILVNNIAADITSVTDLSGEIRCESAKPGIYLVSAVEVVLDGKHCSFSSTLVALPGLDETGLWQYAVTANPKPQIQPPAGLLEFKVLKLWKGADTNRPDHIEVEIFRNGVSWETVTLSEENRWGYTWTVPDDGAQWMVAERNIPTGYTVTVEKRTTTFILTNTLQTDTPPTGDFSQIGLYTALLSGIALVLLARKRKRL